MTELTNISSLQSDFTAADNTITSTEAALKSAGIEADTLQDGVMQLVKKLEAVAAENVKIKLCNDVLSEELRGYESDGAFPDPIAHKLWYSAEHPETDRLLAERDLQCRKEGIHFAANRMLAAWEAGFIDDTPAQAYDISGAVLSALEFLPNASPGEFTRDYADEVRAAIANQLRTTEKTDPVEKITELPVDRDKYGYWTHPVYNDFCDGREHIPAAEFNAFLKDQGLESLVIYRDEDEIDPTVDGYDISSWEPESPAGDGWFVVSIHDTEDGAVCIWFRTTGHADKAGD